MPSYVTAEGGKNAKLHKYNGKDLSLLYAYINSPLAEAGVKLMPLWMAPNLITLSGFAFVILSHLILLAYDPLLNTPAPGWVYILNGVCLLIYSIFDNMDGKQARRTKSSSALGLLFDHGCDAINAGVLSSVSFCSCIQTGPDVGALIVFASVLVPFYIATWEEVHLHKFILPIINGPNEGLFVTITMYILTGFVGPETWHNTFAFGTTTWYQVFLVIAVLPALLTVVYQIINVARSVSEHNISFVVPVYRLIPLIVALSFGMYWAIVAPTAFQQYPRMFLAAIGLVGVDGVVKLMLANVCQQPFAPSWWLGLVLAGGVANILAGSPINEVHYLFVFMALATVNISHFAVVGMNELADALQIKCFSIKSDK